MFLQYIFINLLFSFLGVEWIDSLKVRWMIWNSVCVECVEELYRCNRSLESQTSRDIHRDSRASSMDIKLCRTSFFFRYILWQLYKFQTTKFEYGNVPINQSASWFANCCCSISALIIGFLLQLYCDESQIFHQFFLLKYLIYTQFNLSIDRLRNLRSIKFFLTKFLLLWIVKLFKI